MMFPVYWEPVMHFNTTSEAMKGSYLVQFGSFFLTRVNACALCKLSSSPKDSINAWQTGSQAANKGRAKVTKSQISLLPGNVHDPKEPKGHKLALLHPN